MKFSNLAELVKDNLQYTIISNIIWETYEKRLSRKDVFDLLKHQASPNLKRVLLMEGVIRPGTVIAIGDCFERAYPQDVKPEDIDFADIEPRVESNPAQQTKTYEKAWMDVG